ncbi:hypothetical protein ACOME3_000269 [Neoechinorhynchus agilis]
MNTGVLRSKQPLDRENADNHQLDIIISNADFSRIEQAKVHIEVMDINDNAPKFIRPSPNETIKIYFSTGFVCDIQVYDGDLGQNALVHVKLDPHPYFELRQNGLYSIRAPEGVHSIRLVAGDMGIPPRQTSINVFCEIDLSEGTIGYRKRSFSSYNTFKTYVACILLTLIVMILMSLTSVGCIRHMNPVMFVRMCTSKAYKTQNSMSPMISPGESNSDKNSQISRSTSNYGYMPITTLQKYSVV